MFLSTVFFSYHHCLFNLEALASNLMYNPNSNGLPPRSDGLPPGSNGLQLFFYDYMQCTTSIYIYNKQDCTARVTEVSAAPAKTVEFAEHLKVT